MNVSGVPEIFSGGPRNREEGPELVVDAHSHVDNVLRHHQILLESSEVEIPQHQVLAGQKGQGVRLSLAHTLFHTKCDGR